MKKIMSYVFGLILCILCFIPLQANAEVKAESLSDRLVVLAETNIVNPTTIQVKLIVQSNSGLCGLEIHSNFNKNTFNITSTNGYSLSSLIYEGDSSTGIFTWGPADGSPNVTSCGTILNLKFELKSASNGTHTIKFVPTACFNNGGAVKDKPVSIQSVKVSVENGVISGTEVVNETAGMPTWAIILIVCGGVAVIGGITAYIIKTKKKPKSWQKIH